MLAHMDKLISICEKVVSPFELAYVVPHSLLINRSFSKVIQPFDSPPKKKQDINYVRNPLLPMGRTDGGHAQKRPS